MLFYICLFFVFPRESCSYIPDILSSLTCAKIIGKSKLEQFFSFSSHINLIFDDILPDPAVGDISLEKDAAHFSIP